MSAFIVANEHIALMISACQQLDVPARRPIRWQHQGNLYDLRTSGATTVGQMLLDANAASVAAAADVDSLTPPPYTHRSTLHRGWTAVEVLKAIHCYQYQSCDSPEWESTQAHAFCRALEYALITSLPGYARAPWSISAATTPGITASH